MFDLPNEEILPLSKEHVFYTWSAQAKVNPIAVKRARGVYFFKGALIQFGLEDADQFIFAHEGFLLSMELLPFEPQAAGSGKARYMTYRF
jgi:hypothetical protein